MITPRQTRLVRVSDLHQFRHVIRTWCRESIRLAEASAGGPDTAEGSQAHITYDAECVVVVPTTGAARQIARQLPAHERQPIFATRDQLYDVLPGQLPSTPSRLTTFQRESIFQAAAADAARRVPNLPFQLRPGLVTEMMRFYDHLRRQGQEVDRFEALIADALGVEEEDADRGAQRLLVQTRFLASAFREYERRVTDDGVCDEHFLRTRIMSEAPHRRVRHVLVTVADWIADPAGLFPVDFDLLSRLPGLETIDLVCTEGVLASGFHERIHHWWPGLEEVDVTAFGQPPSFVRPYLACPPSGGVDRPWFTYRDREEELVAVASRLRNAEAESWDRSAVVYKRPLPYLYMAPESFGAAGVTYQASDALPLAAQPVVATIDLVLDAVESKFAREPLLALLVSPHFRFADVDQLRQSVSALNVALSESRYLGGVDRLEAFVLSSTAARPGPVAVALQTALAIARDLSVLAEPRPASQQLAELLDFLERYFRRLDPADPFAAREQEARTAVGRVLQQLAGSRKAYNDSPWSIDELAAAVRRWIGDQTFPIEDAVEGVHFLDDQAARYGEFDDITIVGLVENEWPERPRRNIFYPPRLLKALGWPTEKDRQAAADAHFLDLLPSASREVALSTFTLEDEAIVSRSMQLDEVPRAKLSVVVREGGPHHDGNESGRPKGLHYVPDNGSGNPEGLHDVPDTGSGRPAGLHDVPDNDRAWAELRRARTPASSAVFHGTIGCRDSRPWSVSALETYTTCPFKFFAQHVLKLAEEPDDEEIMDPRRQGQFVHQVFQSFFAKWQASGHGAITSANFEQARALFTAVVDSSLEKARLPEGEAALERTRLLGSSAAAGLGEAVFRMEAERPTTVVERLLEHELTGSFAIPTASGTRVVELRGKADRLDLLADGTFRLIDYKLGWPPDRNRALQLPIYSICAEQRLTGRRGRTWTLGEAVYLAFKGPRRVVPLFTSATKDDVLGKAQQRLVETIDAIARGEFPPTPDDVFRCETCSFASVCRKDYVGNV